jgi:hypothetical protein
MLVTHESFFTYVYQCLLFAMIGLVLSGALEWLFHHLDQVDETPQHEAFIMTVHLCMAIVVLYIMEKHVSPSFASSWQHTTAGLFFVAFFFRLQPTMIKSAYSVQGMIWEKDQHNPC